MRIKSLKISNILSFPYLEDFENSPETIIFKDDLNILIGANGAGKSNLIEIIYKILQYHFFQSFYIDEENVGTALIKINQDKKERKEFTLFNHFNHLGLPSTVEINFLLDGDKSNVLFLVKNFNDFKDFSSLYCDNNFFSSVQCPTIEEVNSLKSISTRFSLSGNNIHPNNSLSPVELFFYHYFVNFNQIQLLIDIVNKT